MDSDKKILISDGSSMESHDQNTAVDLTNQAMTVDGVCQPQTANISSVDEAEDEAGSVQQVPVLVQVTPDLFRCVYTIDHQQLLGVKDLPLASVYMPSCDQASPSLPIPGRESDTTSTVALQNNNDAKIDIVLENAEEDCQGLELVDGAAGGDSSVETETAGQSSRSQGAVSSLFLDSSGCGQRLNNRSSSKVILRRGSCLLSPDHAMAENENNMNMVAARRLMDQQRHTVVSQPVTVQAQPLLFSAATSTAVTTDTTPPPSSTSPQASSSSSSAVPHQEAPTALQLLLNSPLVLTTAVKGSGDSPLGGAHSGGVQNSTKILSCLSAQAEQECTNNNGSTSTRGRIHYCDQTDAACNIGMEESLDLSVGNRALEDETFSPSKQPGIEQEGGGCWTSFSTCQTQEESSISRVSVSLAEMTSNDLIQSALGNQLDADPHFSQSEAGADTLSEPTVCGDLSRLGLGVQVVPTNSDYPILFQVLTDDGSVQNISLQTTGVTDKPTTVKPGASNRVLKRGPETYRCELCNATFNRFGNYTRHRMVHTINTKDDQRYRCEDCGRLFLQRCDLQRHMHIHKGTHPYKCDVCGKGYIRKSDLVVHMRFHTREKAFKCTQCSRAFYQSGDLRRHIRKIHQNARALMCGHCQRKYSTEATLIRHMQTVHRDIILMSLSDNLQKVLQEATEVGSDQTIDPSLVNGTDLGQVPTEEETCAAVEAVLPEKSNTDTRDRTHFLQNETELIKSTDKVYITDSDPPDSDT